jgi:hypothetical protein
MNVSRPWTTPSSPTVPPRASRSTGPPTSPLGSRTPHTATACSRSSSFVRARFFFVPLHLAYHARKLTTTMHSGLPNDEPREPSSPRDRPSKVRREERVGGDEVDVRRTMSLCRDLCNARHSHNFASCQEGSDCLRVCIASLGHRLITRMIPSLGFGKSYFLLL